MCSSNQTHLTDCVLYDPFSLQANLLLAITIHQDRAELRIFDIRKSRNTLVVGVTLTICKDDGSI